MQDTYVVTKKILMDTHAHTLDTLNMRLVYSCSNITTKYPLLSL